MIACSRGMRTVRINVLSQALAYKKITNEIVMVWKVNIKRFDITIPFGERL